MLALAPLPTRSLSRRARGTPPRHGQLPNFPIAVRRLSKGNRRPAAHRVPRGGGRPAGITPDLTESALSMSRVLGGRTSQAAGVSPPGGCPGLDPRLVLAHVGDLGVRYPDDLLRVDQNRVPVVSGVAEHAIVVEHAPVDDLRRRQHLAERWQGAELELR